MNNLKRVLSMALASVMVIGSVVVGSSAADFADKADIKNTEAVNAMVALNILKGKEDGTNFAPNDLVTRAEMAKMIFVALNGGKDNNALTTKAQPTYTDIKGTWAEGYIEYCSALGIISGKGDGTFDPTGTVTGQQAAKMLLICIGYDPDAAGLQGTVDWGINTDSLAFTKGFYNGVSIATGDFLSRDNAAQIVYNALQAKMVEYDYKLTTDNTNLTTKAIVKDKKVTEGNSTTTVDLLEDRYELVTVKGVLTKVEESKDSGKTVYTLDSSKWVKTKDENVTVSGPFKKVPTNYANLLGQEVKVMYKKNHTDDVFGVYATSNNSLVVTTAQNKVGTVSNSKTKIKFGGVEYDTSDSLNLGLVDEIKDGEFNGKVHTLQEYKQGDADKNFDNMTIIDNTGDGKVDTVLITTVKAAKVTYKSSTEVVAGGETYKFEDDEIPADIAKDDYIVVWADPTKNEDKHILTKLEAITGTVTGVKDGNSSGKPQEIQLNGTWYKNFNKLNSGEPYDTNNNVTAYVYNGIVAYAEATSAANMNDVAVVVAYNTSGVAPQAKIMYTDKTVKTVDVNTEKSELFLSDYEPDGTTTITYSSGKSGFKGNTGDSKNRVTFDNADAKEYLSDEKRVQGKFFEVTSTSSGYKLLECVDGKKVGGNTYVANAYSTDINDSAVVLAFNDSHSTKTYTGKQLKNNKTTLGGGAIAGFTAKSNGLDRIAFASVMITGSWPTGLSSNGDKFAYVTANSWKIDGATQYTIWTGTESITVTDKDEKREPKKHAIVSYNTIDNGEIKGATIETTVKGSLQGKSGSNYVYLNGTSEGGSYNTTDPSKNGDKYKIESDTVILYVNTADAKGMTTGEIVIADDVKVVDPIRDAKGKITGFGKSYKFYTNNVVWAAGKSTDEYDELDVLVVDVKNKLGNEVNVKLGGVKIADDPTGIGKYFVDGKSKVKSGDVIKVDLSGLATVNDVTLVNAKFLDNTVLGSDVFTIVATGMGDVDIQVNP